MYYTNTTTLTMDYTDTTTHPMGYIIILEVVVPPTQWTIL